jgi:thiol-disulfide isomerase/thioredoxin
MKRKTCLLVLLCLFGSAVAQNKNSSLVIGDKLPDITAKNVIHHPTSEIKLSGYKGKILILDFWATWCSPCISLLPKTDSLQKIFKEEVQFLPVTYEPKEKVERLFSKLPKLKGVSLPLVIQDETLHKLFPHKTLPHYVWIDRTGTVIAVTEAVNATNIQNMIAGQTDLEVKTDVVIPFSKEQPLLIGSNGGGAEHLKYHRLITGYIEGVPGGYHVFKADSLYGGRIQATNVPLPWLWQLAFSNGTKLFGYNQTVFEVKDPAPLLNNSVGKKYEAWLSGNGYGYELVVPKGFKGNMYALMQEDLALFYPQYEVKVESRKKPCLALVRTSIEDKIKSKGGKSSFEFDATGGTLNNWTLAMLAAQLNTKYLQHLSTPVVDQTNYKSQVDLKINADMSNIESIRKALQPYGLDLITSECDLEVIVVRDTKK